jgi:hypothetical protein
MLSRKPFQKRLKRKPFGKRFDRKPQQNCVVGVINRRKGCSQTD